MTFLLLSSLVFSAKAEYDGFFTALTFELHDGTETSGYLYFIDIYVSWDSVENSDYLKQKIRSNYIIDDDQFNYYKDLLNYRYAIAGEIGVMRTMSNQSQLSMKAIKHIKVTKRIRQHYLTWIASSHTLADTIWMQKAPLERFYFYMNVAEYSVIIHEKSPEIERFRRAITGDYDENDMDIQENEWTELPLEDLLEKLKQHKVVVIGSG